MKLYQISDEYRNLMAQIEEADGEISDEQKLLLDSLTEQGEQKIESIAMLIRELDAEAEALETESVRMANKSKAIENRVAWLKDYVKAEMRSMGTTGVDGKLLKIRIQNNPPSVNVVDETVLPESYIKVKEVRSIDRRAILDDYKASGECPSGCEITVGTSLRIR